MGYLGHEVDEEYSETGYGLYCILVEPWAVYVKEYQFFKDQGGFKEPWVRTGKKFMHLL